MLGSALSLYPGPKVGAVVVRGVTADRNSLTDFPNRPRVLRSRRSSGQGVRYRFVRGPDGCTWPGRVPDRTWGPETRRPGASGAGPFQSRSDFRANLVIY